MGLHLGTVESLAVICFKKKKTVVVCKIPIAGYSGIERNCTRTFSFLHYAVKKDPRESSLKNAVK